MLIKPPAGIASSAITPRATYLRRRDFLAALVTLPIAGRMVTTSDALTAKPSVTSYTNYYEFGSDKGDAVRNGGAFKPSPWSVTIEGQCAKPGTYTLEDILKPHPLEERVYRMRCVEGWSMVIPWDGFPLAKLLTRFEPNARAKFVEFTTVNRPQEMPGIRRGVLPFPYVEGLRMDEAMHPLTILAAGLYGETLLTQNGAPLRLVVPWKYGFKSVKAIVKIRFVERQPINTWQEANASYYGFYANVNPDVATPSYSQATERRIGDFFQRRTLPFNGYADQVASMYAGMDPKRLF
jgi:methionine sulfoxide reductase catalytic subunit